MKASGGVPVKTSSAVGRSTCCENVSALASTSRWKCMVAFGRPVVPEVNASSATSSAAVSTSSNRSDAGSTRSVMSSSASPPYATTRRPGMLGADEVVEEPVVAQGEVDLRDLGDGGAARRAAAAASSCTTTAPALSTPNQQATSHGLLGPRSSTRLPGTTSVLVDEEVRDLVGRREQVAVRPATRVGARRHGRSAPCSRDDVVEQLDRAVEPVGVLHLGEVEEQLGPLRRRAAGCPGRTCRRGRTARAASGRLRVGLPARPSVWPCSDDSQESAISRPRDGRRRALSWRRDDGRSGERRAGRQPSAAAARSDRDASTGCTPARSAAGSSVGALDPAAGRARRRRAGRPVVDLATQARAASSRPSGSTGRAGYALSVTGAGDPRRG